MALMAVMTLLGLKAIITFTEVKALMTEILFDPC